MCADRRTFKLISSASLHLAIKTHFPHVWHDVGKLLPDLSRGDFIMSDLLAMERELVHSLTWLLNPPTPQSMAIHMLSLLPFDAPRSVMDNITNTTLFLVELSVCDYSFVTTRKSIVAIAAVLNAAESLEFEPLDFQIDVCSYQNDQHMHIEKMLLDIGYHVDWYEVTSVRDRLWSLYQQSSETMLRQRVHSPVTETNKSIGDRSALLQGYPSPTSCLSPAFDNYGNQDFSQNRTRVHSDFDYYGRNHFNCPEVNRHSRPSITHSI